MVSLGVITLQPSIFYLYLEELIYFSKTVNLKFIRNYRNDFIALKLKIDNLNLANPP